MKCARIEHYMVFSIKLFHTCVLLCVIPSYLSDRFYASCLRLAFSLSLFSPLSSDSTPNPYSTVPKPSHFIYSHIPIHSLHHASPCSFCCFPYHCQGCARFEDLGSTPFGRCQNKLHYQPTKPPIDSPISQPIQRLRGSAGTYVYPFPLMPSHSARSC